MPGRKCSVAGCSSVSWWCDPKNKAGSKQKQSEDWISFHMFPKDPAVRREWIKRCNREPHFFSKDSRICSKHFTLADYMDAMQAKVFNTKPKKLKPDAVPTVDIKSESTQFAKSNRSERYASKERKKMLEELLKAPPEPPPAKPEILNMGAASLDSSFEILQPAIGEMPLCIVYGCPYGTVTNANTSVQYYAFPSDPDIAHKWINASGWDPHQVDLKLAKMCSTHFDEDSYTNVETKSCSTKVLNPDAIPTLRLPTSEEIIIHSEWEDDKQEENDLKGDVIVFTIPDSEENDPTPPTFGRSEDTKLILQIQPRIIATGDDEFADEPEEDMKRQIEIIDVNETSPSDVSGKITRLQYDEQQIEIIDVDADASKNNARLEYDDVKTLEQLRSLREKNRNLRKQIASREQFLLRNKSTLLEMSANFQAMDSELNQLRAELLKKNQSASAASSKPQPKVLSLKKQKELLSKVFSKAQIRLLCGKKRSWWSDDDMAVGYTLRHLSDRRCYMYLRKYLKLPLPAIPTIQHWTFKAHDASRRPKIANETCENEDSEIQE